MKSIYVFYIGAGLDLIALCVALFFILGDINSPSGGTNNPTMYKAILAMLTLVGLAFLAK